MPPSKLPMLTLMKQARAFGLGVVLATQNPVDLDYKGLGNAGTWFIGRLQTERDRERVIDGLLSAQAGAGFDRGDLARLMAGIAPRVFLMRNVNDDAPTLFRTRWALSWLRGPLTLPEITRLMAGRKPAAGSATAASRPPRPPQPAARPALPAGVEEVFLAAKPGDGELVYRPRIVATAELHYADKPAGVDSWTRSAWLAPLADGDGAPQWAEASAIPSLDAVSAPGPVDGATFSEVACGGARREELRANGARRSPPRLYQEGAVELLAAKALKLTSNPGESEGDFRARLAQGLREFRDGEVAKLRAKHAAKLKSLEDRLRRASDRVEREESQYSQRKLDTAISIGTSVLGAIFGGRSTATTRAGSAARSAGRVFGERGDVARAGESLEALKAERDALLAAHRAGGAVARIEPRPGERRAREGPHRAAQVRHRDRPRRHRLGALARGRGRLPAPGLDAVSPRAPARGILRGFALVMVTAALMACAREEGPPLGIYRAVVQVDGGDLPFGLELAQRGRHARRLPHQRARARARARSAPLRRQAFHPDAGLPAAHRGDLARRPLRGDAAAAASRVR